MASWLHKTNGTYRVSSDPPLAEQGAWIRNPTLPDGCTDWTEVVVDGDAVRAPNEAEAAARLAAKLAAAKVEKVTAIDSRTAALLVGGIVVASGKTISTTLAATQNLQDLALGHMLGVVLFPQQVSTIDGGSYTITDAADLLRIAALLRDHKLNVLGSGRTLRAQVLACTTLAEVAAVEDLR